MNYLVLYTERCSPKIKEFKTKKAALAFVTRFLETHNDDDHWVDAIILGEVVETYPQWYGKAVGGANG